MLQELFFLTVITNNKFPRSIDFYLYLGVPNVLAKGRTVFNLSIANGVELPSQNCISVCLRLS
jgi:hypothetical protein